MARFTVPVTLITAVVLAGACTATRAAPSVADGAATVVAVSDGDTIDVDFGGDIEAVRLLGIDTSNPANLHPGPTPSRWGDGGRLRPGRTRVAGD